MQFILCFFFQNTADEDGDGNGGHRIWEKDFADLLLTYADYSPKKRAAVLKRVKKKHQDRSEGIGLNDYIQIFSLLIHIDDVDKVILEFCAGCGGGGLHYFAMPLSVY